MPRKNKIYITISYVVIAAIIAVAPFYLDSSRLDDILPFDYSDFWSGFTAWAFQLRFDWAVLLFILPLIVGLFLTSRRGIPEADSILVLLMGILILGPLLVGFTFYVSNPYRFVPMRVFFAVGVGNLLSKRTNQED